MPSSGSSLFARAEFRLVAFGLSALAAVYLGFIGIGVEEAGMLVKRFGYYMIFATFALWGVMLWRLWHARLPGEPMARREWILAAAAIAVLSMLAVMSEPFRSKVLYDEFVLQSTAYNMHYFRDTATMVRGYDILGAFLSLDNYLDKRPNFYPFLISLVHDFTGYRTANAHWLNAALYPVTLGLAYYLGRRLAGRWGAMLAVLLLGSLPVLGQNATGSGMELLNFCMILAVAALGGAYLRSPDPTRLSALVLGAVLLAQSRYESAAYVGPVALVILIGWWRRGEVILSWTAVAAPLLLLPLALQNKVLNNTKWMWELKQEQESRFSLAYLEPNLASAREYLFSTTQRYSNSLTLGILGGLALGWLLWRLVSRRPALREADGDRLSLFLMGLAAVGNTVLIMFYYWSSFSDPMASRFSLPLYLVLTFTVVFAGAMLAQRAPMVRAALLGAACLAVVTATSRFATPLYSHTGIDEIEWERRFVAARGPGPRLILTNKSTLPWLLQQTPSILVGRAGLMADRMEAQMQDGAFSEILVMQSFRPTTADGHHEMQPGDRLPKGFETETLAERRFGTKITRISRLVAVQPPKGAAQPATTR